MLLRVGLDAFFGKNEQRFVGPLHRFSVRWRDRSLTYVSDNFNFNIAFPCDPDVVDTVSDNFNFFKISKEGHYEFQKRVSWNIFHAIDGDKLLPLRPESRS